MVVYSLFRLINPSSAKAINSFPTFTSLLVCRRARHGIVFTLFSRIPLLVVIVISFLLFSTADYKAKQEFTQTRHSSALSPVGATSNLTMLKLRQPPFFHSLPHPLLKTFGRQTPFIPSNFRGLSPIPFFLILNSTPLKIQIHPYKR